MDKGIRVRQKKDKVISNHIIKSVVDTIIEPQGCRFIISPVVCFEALHYVPKHIQQSINVNEAIKTLLLMQGNLEHPNGFIQKTEQKIKQSIKELDKFWIKNLNKCIYGKTQESRDISKIEGINSPYGLRQAYFGRYPEFKYKHNHPLLLGRTAHDNLDKINLSQLKQISNQTLKHWQKFIKQQKGNLLQFYQFLYTAIDCLIECKNLE